MTTIAGLPASDTQVAPSLAGRRFDHAFFTGMALLMLATVFAGFAPTYFLVGMFRAPLPSLIIHVHGAVFSCWVLLLVIQTSLVSAGRVDLHRRLGLAGFVLGCLMVVLGPWAATDSLIRGAGPVGRDTKAFYLIPLTDVLIFATLLFFAFRARRDSPTHKRLIYVATTALLVAAIARLPIPFSHRLHPQSEVLSWVFLIVLVGYDLWSTRKIHSATLRASAFLVLVQLIRMPISRTALWHDFAAWVSNSAR